MNGTRLYLYGSLAAFAAAQTTILAIDNLTVRASLQLATGLLMFIAGALIGKRAGVLTERTKNSEPP